jgi:hypothetical protein
MSWRQDRTRVLGIWTPRIGRGAALLRWKVAAWNQVAMSLGLASVACVTVGFLADVQALRVIGGALFVAGVLLGLAADQRPMRAALRASLEHLGLDPDLPQLRKVTLPPYVDGAIRSVAGGREGAGGDRTVGAVLPP